MPIQEYYAYDDSASTIAPSVHNVVPVTSLREYYAPGLPARTATGFQGPRFDVGIKLDAALETEQGDTLFGHRGPVLAVAFSCAGTEIAAGSKDGSVRIWSMNRTNYRKNLLGHTDMVTTVAFSPDDTMVASGSGDRSIRLWNVSQSQLKRELRGHEGAITAVAFSSGAAYIVSASEDRTVCIWDTETCTCRKVSGQKPQLAAAAFVKGGTLAALSSAGMKPSLKLFDLQDPDFRFLPGLEAVAHAVAFSRDAKIVAAGLADNTVQWWDITNDESRISTGHSAPVFAIACSPDGKLVASGSADGDVRIWNRAVAQNNFVINTEAKVWAVAFSPNGKMIAVGLGNGSVRLLGGALSRTTPTDKTLKGTFKKYFGRSDTA